MYKGYAKARVEVIGNIAGTRSYLDDLDDQENQSRATACYEPATSLLRACYKPAMSLLGAFRNLYPNSDKRDNSNNIYFIANMAKS